MGLFDRKKKTGFELPEKLEMLLEIAIKNGVVSEKELSVLRAEELTNAWRSKVDSLFADAKELAGNLFSGDRQFKTKLSELSDQ